MEESDAEREAKVDEYMGTMGRYVVASMAKPENRRSCIAVLFLVFAGVDGLGKLVHPNTAAGVGDRFKDFLPRLGPPYCAADIRKRLYKLRCDLVHNALHSAAFLSAAENYGSIYQHLSTTPQGSIYVNTEAFYTDFCHAFDQLKVEFAQDKCLLNEAGRRLKRQWFTPSEDWGDTTPPGPIDFVS